jgi:hypothetical protein
MQPRLAALPLVFFGFVACGGQIDGSVFDPGSDAAVAIDGAVDAAPPATDTSTPPPGPGPQPVDAGPPSPPPTGGGDGSACTSAAQCAGGVCQQGRCTSSCGSSADCVPGWRCSTQSMTCRCMPSGADCGGRDNNCDGVVSSNAPCGGPTPSDAGPPPPPFDAGPPPPPPTGDAGLSCATCAQSSCSTATNNCGSDAACRAFLQCVQPCASIPSTCVSQCAAKNSSPATQAFLSCMTASCAGCT